MTDGVLLVISTFPDQETARSIAHVLVSDHLVACANILPQMHSIYRWQGAVDDASETLVLFKTTAMQYRAMEQRLKELHPYELPEVIAVSIDDGSAAYLKWIADSCRG